MERALRSAQASMSSREAQMGVGLPVVPDVLCTSMMLSRPQMRRPSGYVSRSVSFSRKGRRRTSSSVRISAGSTPAARHSSRYTELRSQAERDDGLQTLELERPQGAGLERLELGLESGRAAPTAPLDEPSWSRPSPGPAGAAVPRRRPPRPRLRCPAAKAARFSFSQLGGTFFSIARCQSLSSNGRRAASAPTSTTPATFWSPTSSATALPSTTTRRCAPAP